MNEVTRTEQGQNESAGPKRDAAAVEIGPERPRPDTKSEESGKKLTLEVPELTRKDRVALREGTSGVVRNQRERDEIRGQHERLELSLGDADKTTEGAKTPKVNDGLGALFPSLGVLSRLQGAPANDHLENLELGDGTFLNAREFKYASFFNRLKRGVSQHWDPFPEYRRRDPTGNVYGYQGRVTVLSITLTEDGSLRDVSVQRSSGLDFLDNEAIVAFRRAQPFPNPPKGLMEGGVVTFPFSFHISFNEPGLGGLPF